VNALSVAKWRAYLQLQRDLEGALGESIYRYLSGVVETTFGPGGGDVRRPGAPR
jgi:hypothetical protein